MGFWILYQNVCFLNFRYFLFFCFFRLQISLKIWILVWVLLFLILTKSLGLNKYRIECCIDTYFRFFAEIQGEPRKRTIEREIRSVPISLKIRIHIKAYFLPTSTVLPELLPVSFSLCFSVYTLN